MHALAHDFAAELCRFKLMVIADGGKYAGDGDGLNALCLHILKKCLRRGGIQRSKLPAVILKAAADDGAADGDPANILRPVDHGADAGGCGRADAQDADGSEIFALDDGVRTLRRAEHRLPDLFGVHTGDLQHGAHRAQNAAVNIGRGRVFNIRRHGPVFIHQNGIRIRAAHVDSEFIHRQFPPLQRSSSGM